MISFTHPIHKALYAADEALTARGLEVYGKQWCCKRYQSEPHADRILEDLSNAYVALGAAYNAACAEARLKGQTK